MEHTAAVTVLVTAAAVSARAGLSQLARTKARVSFGQLAVYVSSASRSAWSTAGPHRYLVATHSPMYRQCTAGAGIHVAGSWSLF